MIPKIRKHSYSQRLNELKRISLLQMRLQGKLMELHIYLNPLSDSTQPVQKGSLIMTSMTEQGAMD